MDRPKISFISEKFRGNFFEGFRIFAKDTRMEHEETRDAETTTGGQGPTRPDKDSGVNGPCPPPKEMEEGKHQETPTGVEGFTINLGNVRFQSVSARRRLQATLARVLRVPKMLV